MSGYKRSFSDPSYRCRTFWRFLFDCVASAPTFDLGDLREWNKPLMDGLENMENLSKTNWNSF